MSIFLAVCLLIAGTLLSLAGVLAVYRVQKGPSLLDRVLALDVLVTVFVGAIAIFIVTTEEVESVVLLVVLAVVGWLGTLSFTLFLAARKESERP